MLNSDNGFALSLHDACKAFRTPEGKTVSALDNVNFCVRENEFVTLLGPSGCGKTTLLRCISGFEELDSGRLTIDGRSMQEVPANRRPVNTVFQNYALFPHMSVQDNVGFSMRVAGTHRHERQRRISNALQMVNLDGMQHRKPAQLSGGQQQRVALARALVNRPRTLLLDEPLSALDRKLRQAMQLELKNLQTELGISFVFVTHDQEEALTMSDRIIVLNAGQIQQIGTPAEIYHKPANLFVADFIGESNLLLATVTSHDDSSTSYTVQGGLTLRGQRFSETMAPGTAVTLLLRPEYLTLAAAGQAVESAYAHIDLIFNKQVFVGTDNLLFASTANHKHEFRAKLRLNHEARADSLTQGEAVRLTYPLHRLHVLPDSH
ncbi:MAG: ABC transporter ATP-binding protein [Granulosicoccus sp.]